MDGVVERGSLISVAPGLYVDPSARADLDPRQAYVLLDEMGLRSLGLGPGQLKMMERLDHAGLIEIFSVTPRRKLLKLSSWNAHLATVRRDPEFWDRPDIKRRWKLACLSV